MENANSPEYLEKIKTQVIENLKRTNFAPSVQMTDIPGDSVATMDDAERADDDLDEDDNKDVRYTKRRWDKHISRDDELSESEDEDMNEQNGVRRQPGQKRRRHITDYPNPFAVAADALDGEFGTPTAARSVNGDASGVEATANAANSDSRAAATAKSQRSSPAEDGTVPGEQRVDEDGDVDMDMDRDDVDADDGSDAAAPTAEATAADGTQSNAPFRTIPGVSDGQYSAVVVVAAACCVRDGGRSGYAPCVCGRQCGRGGC